MAEAPQMTPAQIADQLEATMSLIRAYVAERTDAELSAHETSEDWCAKECIAHLIDGERVVDQPFVKGALEKDGFELKRPGEGDAAPAPAANAGTPPAPAPKLCERPVGEFVETLAKIRTESVRVLRSLSAEQSERKGSRFGKIMTIGELSNGWAGHDRNHFAQMIVAIDAARSQAGEGRSAPPTAGAAS